jgi:hypothetical protein
MIGLGEHMRWFWRIGSDICESWGGRYAGARLPSKVYRHCEWEGTGLGGSMA